MVRVCLQAGRTLSNESIAWHPRADLREGQLLWEAIDHPCVHKVDWRRFAEELEPIRRMAPRYFLSGHLPPASGIVGSFLDTIAATPDVAPYVGPDQETLEKRLGQLSGSPGTKAQSGYLRSPLPSCRC